ncbi:molybdopterin-guanine dinucleotide biosynthesis protein B [Paenibacillus sp. sgz5001063]|uniref:molybdopterin-guanine dinucleotide biosynthesis protein B n=1 Tax=Paenibacillus sp. sgz5001063 TaxID=3242474 RepID=UPI0036D34E51
MRRRRRQPLKSLKNVSSGPAVFQIVGYKNSGKTSLICDLIPLLQQRGCSVAVIKHDGHDFNMDHEGTDTWKHRQAGASAVAITSKGRTSVIRERGSSLAELIDTFVEYDFVLVEGFKQERYPKIVLIHREEDIFLLDGTSHIMAMAVWESIQDHPSLLLHNPDIQRFDINNRTGLAQFLWQQRDYFQNFNI